MDSSYHIEASVAAKVSFASQQNSIPVLHELVILNQGDEPLQDVELTVSSSPPVFTTSHWQIARIGAGQRYRIPNPDLQIDGDVLARLTEAEKGSLRFVLQAGERELAVRSVPLEFLARNEWGGIGHLPELAAAFVQPNDPAVQRLLGKTVDMLALHGKTPSLVGYERGKKGVWEQLAALWNVISAERIGYSLPPASFEQTGQKVRHPSEILDAGIGTCLDLTMLFASCMEQCGLGPILVVIQGHALVGCWLADETFSTVVVDDVTALRKRLHLQELLLFETTLALQQETGAVSFKDSCGHAERLLAPERDPYFLLVVDVRRARKQRILPLALGEGVKPNEAVKRSSAPIVEPQFDEAPEFVIDGTGIEERGSFTRLDQWQRRLLDLSLRNNLINFRAGKRVVELIAPDPGRLEDMLADGHRFRILSGSDPHGSTTLPRELILDALERGRLLASLPQKELDGRLLELYRSARSASEEGGANTLFLALGFLVWKPGDREKPCKAPLVLVPVKLDRKSTLSGFSLSLHDDEPRFNLTLLEMLRKDFKISQLDVFEKDLPKDAHGLDIDLIWVSVQKAVKDITGWELSRTISLGLFSFAKYLMWKDLVDHTEDLRRNPVVRHLLDTPGERYGGGSQDFLDPRQLDAKLPARNVFCPLPADSSQLTAVTAAAQGKDFVLIGPPGTGKSQTISNTIAQCLAEGKTVLFVAEKTAALNVVYRRLKDIGLGNFCLELHSHKARKVEVLEQLKDASKAETNFVEDCWDRETGRLGDLRKKLNDYVGTLHKSYPNGFTPFQAIGMVVRHPGVPPVGLSWLSPQTHDRTDFTRLRDIVTRIGLHSTTARALESSFLRTIRRLEWSPGWAADLVNAAGELAVACRWLESTVATLTEITGIPAIPLDSRGRNGLERLAGLLPKAAGKNYLFLLRRHAPGFTARLREGAALVQQYHNERSNGLSVAYSDEALQLDHPVLASIWQLTSAPWLPRLKEAFDRLHEYGALAGRLSVPYKAEAYGLDYSTLQNLLDESRGRWWPRRTSLQGRVRKALLDASKGEGKGELDWEGDLARLVDMRNIQNQLETLEPLGEEAKWLWRGDPTLPAATCTVFREAVWRAAAHLVDVPNAPVGLGGVLKRLFGSDRFSPEIDGVAPVPVSDRDPAFFLRAHTIRTLQSTAEAGDGAIPDPERDLPKLAALRSLRARIQSFDDLRQATEGFWNGLETTPEEIPAALSYHAELRDAVREFAGWREALPRLLAALGYLFGSGNPLLGRQGAAAVAIADFMTALSGFKEKAQNVSRLTENPTADWLEGDLDSIVDWCNGLQAQQSALHKWCAWFRVRSEACNEGLAPLVDAVLADSVEPDRISEAFEVNYCRWWLNAAVEELPALRSFVGIEHDHRVLDFQELEKTVRELSRQYIRKRLRSRSPAQDKEMEKEWSILKRQMEMKKRHLPLRQLITSIPGVLMHLTPCLLMSPLSIAQYLAPGMKCFDVVIFDEASQIPVWDAIGAMARGKHVVVTGDPRQLPPTNFFNRSEDEQADDEVVQETDMESILEECLGANLPELQLHWHYRSRHESLITFSNHRYYGGTLVTFPSPSSEDRAVSCTHVSGEYQRGGTRTNPAEARAVVSEIVSRLTDSAFTARGWSIGIVTFNSEQQRLIEDLLEIERRKNESLERFFDDDLPEPLIVKNLENVQGDERDMIYFSTTYGPDQAGHVSLNFGPLNKDGGERRLNVAVTRARHELRVFTSLLPDSIDITRTNALGVRDLRLFLDFAHRGPRVFLEEIRGTGGSFESPFEEAVGNALAEKGWTAHPQIGVSRFRIDLGIVDPERPGRYFAGVECDGATYHRAATARDRDTLRERVLRDLGWEILHVWSTEWWTSPQQAANRLHERLTHLWNAMRERRIEEEEIRRKAAAVTQPETPLTESESESPDDLDASEDNGANEPFSDGTSDQPPRLDEAKMIQAVEAVVNEESPVHLEVLANRVARTMGFRRAGKRIRDMVMNAAESRFQITVEDAGKFFWKAGAEVGRCAFCRPGTAGKPRLVRQVAMPELLALARSITPKPGEDPIALMAGYLGFQRLHSATRPRLEAAWTMAATEDGTHRQTT